MKPRNARSPRLRWVSLQFLLVTFGVFSSFTVPLGAQVLPDSSELILTCRVIDVVTEEALEGVEVRSRSLGLHSLTDSLGELHIPIMETGGFLFEFEKEGYDGLVGVIQMVGTAEVLVELNPQSAPAGLGVSLLVGLVREAGTGAPLEGVSISVSGTQGPTVTDGEGRFVVQNIRPGTYLIGFSHLGFEDREVTVEFSQDQRVHLDVLLTMEPIPLDPIEVTVERRSIRLEMAGFYDRRDHGQGQFLGPELLEKRMVSKSTDLFNDFRGIRFINKEAGGGVEETIAFHRGQGVVSFQTVRGICYPAVWIDDVLISRGGEEPALINLRVSPREVAAIEAYASAAQIPSRYSGTGRACGVVLIWTRG